MSISETRLEPQVSGGTNDLRLVASFSNTIFALAIILLVINMRIPNLVPLYSATILLRLLFIQWPAVVTYLFGFVVIGSYWYLQHHMVRLIKRYDHHYVLLNLLALLFVPLLSLTTAVLGADASFSAIAVFAANLCLVGLAYWVLWVYAAYHSRLVGTDVSPRVIKSIGRRCLYLPGAGVLSFLLAFASLGLALLFLVLAILSTLGILWHSPEQV
jgi:uncharacterized membrane protein